MIASLILNTIHVYGGNFDVEAGSMVHVVPSLACSDAMKALIDDNKAAVLALLRIPPHKRPTVNGYLMWRRPGCWVWSEAPEHILATRSTLPAIAAYRRKTTPVPVEMLELVAA